jgi:Tfp pilus assembly protein PilN
MMEALPARPTAVAAGQFVRRALAWWLTELADMAPRSLGRLYGRPRDDAAVLDLTGDQAFLVLRDSDRPAPLSIALGDAPAEARDRIGALLRRHKSSGSATIRISRARLFVTTLDLPRAAERSLDAVLRHQVERLVPLPAADICFAYRVLPRPSNAANLKVAVAVAKRSLVDQAQDLARGLGLAPRQIVAEVAEAGPAPLVIWQAHRSPTVGAARRRLFRVLELTAAVLALLAYGVHVRQLDQVRDGLQQAVAQARQQAAETRSLGQHAARSAEALVFLRARRQEPAPLRVLDDLTTLLPLDAWVSDLTIRGRTVEIVGSARHATDLVALIEGSGVFGHAQFRSPITLLPDGQAERFDLTFDVKAGDLKTANPR